MKYIFLLILSIISINPLFSQGSSQNNKTNTNKQKLIINSIELLGVTKVAQDSNNQADPIKFGGLSSLVYNENTKEYLAISDDRKNIRFYTLAINLIDGKLQDSSVKVLGSVNLQVGKQNLDLINPDPEGIALTKNGVLYISSERDYINQADIFVFDLNGVNKGKLPIDIKYQVNANRTMGVQNNLAFESLVVSPNQKYLYAAIESSLIQDGKASTVDTSSPARIIKYDLQTDLPIAEYVYIVEKIPTAPIAVEGKMLTADNGLAELLALNDDGFFLSLERSYATGAKGTGFSGKIYLVDLSKATNVISKFKLDGKEVPVQKTLVLDLTTLGISIDNVEGMTLGPDLPDGKKTLILVSDDNFNTFVPQTTQLLAFSVSIKTQ